MCGFHALKTEIYYNRENSGFELKLTPHQIHSFGNKSLAYFTITLFTLFGLGVSSYARGQSIPRIEISDNGLAEMSWLSFGPFYASTDAEKEDMLKPFGASEISLGFSSIEGLTTRLRERHDLLTQKQIVVVSLGPETSYNFLQLYKTEANKGTPSSATYLTTEIFSKRAQTVYLMCGSDDGFVCWLNGREIYRWWRPDGRPLSLYDDVVPLKLLAGSNFLLIKACNIEGGWGFGGRLAWTSQAASEYILSKRQYFLTQRIIPVGGAIKLEIPGDPTTRYHVLVTAPSGMVCFDGEVASNSEAGEFRISGKYRIRLQTRHATFDENFYVGDPLQMATEIVLRIKGSTDTERTLVSASAYLHWMARLNEVGNMAPTDMKWNDKVDFILSSLNSIAESVGNSNDPATAGAGLHLVGFRSDIDGQIEHFRLFLPKSYNNKVPLPLVIIPPPAVSVSRPFLDSPFIADHASAVSMGKVAEKFGMGLLWVGYRNLPDGNLAEFAHFDEVMRAVSLAIHIDPTRLYLLGSCNSGMTSAMMVAKWPERFTAVGMINPILHRTQNSVIDNGSFALEPSYKTWLTQEDPVEALSVSPRTKVWVIQTMDEAAHGPKWHTESLLTATARRHGKPPVLDLRVDWEIGTNYKSDIENWEEYFIPWFSTLKGVNASSVDTGNNAKGPIARPFTEPFFLVTPTGGTQADRVFAQAATDSIQAFWKQAFFGRCKTIADRDVTNAIEHSFNLILIGNEDCNAYWRAIKDSVAVGLERDRISIGYCAWKGENMAFEAVIPNPRVKGRTIVLVGSAALNEMAFPQINFPLEGWYSYCVWSNRNHSAQSLAFGDWRD